MAEIGKARSRNKADIARADHSNFHKLSLLKAASECVRLMMLSAKEQVLEHLVLELGQKNQSNLRVGATP
jgi:hypothetical protein